MEKWWHKPGIPVFPVRVTPKADGSGFDKRPMTPHGHQDAKDFRDWDWKDWRKQGCNAIGIVMGGGLYALDVDSYKPGGVWEGWLDQWVPEWHETLQHATPSGGRHLIFKTNGSGPAPTRSNIVPGLDARGEGGWIAMGEGYAVVQDVEPRELPQAALEELRRGAAAHKARSGTRYRKIPHLALGLDETIWADDLMEAHPTLGMALGADWGDRSAGLLRCAGEALRAGVETVEEFGRLVWHSGGNARRHAIEKGWSRPLLRAWDTARGSGKSDFDPLPEGEEDPLGKSGVPHRPIGLRTFADLAAGYVPPSFLIQGLLRRASLYTATGITGSGKTAVMVELSLCVATGTDFGGRKIVTPGPVVYFAGENYEDTLARFIAAAERRGISPGSLPLHIRPDALDIPGRLDDILHELEQIGPSCAVIDTVQSHLGAGVEDDNANKQMLDWALAVRAITKISVRPTTIANAHPIKGATKEQLVPRGGSALLNEIDGNLTVWREGTSSITELHFNKLRGAPFDPINFELETVTTPTLTSAEGDLIPTVLVKSVSGASAASTKMDDHRAIERVLVDMADYPLQSGPDRAARLGLHPKAVQRATRALIDEGSAMRAAGGNVFLTGKGKAAAKVIREKIQPNFDPIPEDEESERGGSPFDD